MMQAKSKTIGWFTYCRTRAFRAGFEDYRTGAPARFGEWGKYNVAYEDGRLVAALQRGKGAELEPLPANKTVSALREMELVNGILEAHPRLGGGLGL